MLDLTLIALGLGFFAASVAYGERVRIEQRFAAVANAVCYRSRRDWDAISTSSYWLTSCLAPVDSNRL